MALLNYTTQISPEKTSAEIQKLLAKAGAEAIMMEYSEGVPTALRFRIKTSFGVQAYLLPTAADPVYKVLLRQASYGGAKNPIPRKYATMEQARRVAWRITKDWVEAQLAIIETEMVNLEQVMLPYMLTNGGTVFEMVRERQLALPEAQT